MEVPIPTSLQAAIYEQLIRQNVTHTKAFQGVFADYGSSLQRCRELQVRNAQLDKEAGELRAENGELHRAVEESKHAAVRSEEVGDCRVGGTTSRPAVRAVEESKHAAVRSEEFTALEAQAQRLQAELTAAYKEKAARADESLQATKQLQVVRDINERQAKELTEAAAELRRAREQAREVRAQLEQLQAAHALVTKEVEARLAEAQSATAAASRLEAENSELLRRILEAKKAEADRMNDMNRMRDEVLAAAKQQAAALLAEARARAGGGLQQGGPGAAAGVGRRGSSQGSEGGYGGDESSQRAQAGEEGLPRAVMRSTPAHEGGCFGLAFDGLGHRLASCGADKTVKLWDPATGALTATLHGAFEGLNSVCFTSDHRLVLGADSRQAVRVWDTASGRLKSSLTGALRCAAPLGAGAGHSSKVTCVDCSAADPQTVVSCAADRTIKVWGLERGYCLRTLMCPSMCSAAAVTRDGATIVSGHFDGTLRFWDLRSGRQAHEVAGLHTQQITSVAPGLLGDLVLTCGKDNLLRAVDVRSFEVRHTLAAPGFNLGGAWAGACLSPSQKYAAAGSADGTVFVWDLPRQALATRLRGGPKLASSAVACAWAPTGAPLATCDKAGAVTLWQSAPAGSAGA
ncbi:hypothetical protein N2152v2_008465 [Parachlorella kessleri]